jgi:type II pantothenate kinase
MIFEIIGVMGAFISESSGINNIILIGSLLKIPQIKCILNRIEKIHNVKFLIPKNPEFGTALGAIKYYEKNYKNV